MRGGHRAGHSGIRAHQSAGAVLPRPGNARRRFGAWAVDCSGGRRATSRRRRHRYSGRPRRNTRSRHFPMRRGAAKRWLNLPCEQRGERMIAAGKSGVYDRSGRCHAGTGDRMQDCHQLFDAESSTYTYVLVDPATRESVMIDPVDTPFEVYSALISRDRLRLRYVLETHTHADHITGSSLLRVRTGAKAAAPLACGIVAADLQLEDGEELRFGGETIRALHTPGHTAGSMSYRWRDGVFTGDSLLIGGCGRTDFQSG